MNEIQRAKIVFKILNKTYPSIYVPLKSRNVFTLLISVLLSAQCTDERVNQITPILFEKANTPSKMIQLPVETIKQIIRPCGLSPRKSQAISSLSEILLKKHNGNVPENMEALEELPGVGHKTASVVMSQAFGVPAFPVDTHIHRLMHRWGFSNGKNVVQTEKDLKRLFPKRCWNKLHLQIIYYGREYCKARECYGLTCKICTSCYPNRKKPIKTKKA